MRAALGREEDVNQTGGSENRTPLMHAAGQSSDNHISILRLLLERPSTDLNLADVNGSTALHLATFCGNIEAVRLLLTDPRVDVNLKDLQFQMTPLISAAGRDNIDILKLFLDVQSVDVNLTFPGSDNGEVTALMWAVMNSKIEAVKVLLDEPRVEVNWMNGRGISAIHVAVAQKSNVKLVELLLAHPRVDANCKNGPLGTSVLHMAAAKNHAEVAELILADSRFTMANALVSEEKRSALSIAAVKANWDVLNVLVNHPSIDLGVKHKNGLTLEEISR